MRYAELNFLIPRDHLHSRALRPEAFDRAGAPGDPKRSVARPETRSVRQSRRARRPKAFGRAGATGDPKRPAELARPETRSVWQSCLC